MPSDDDARSRTRALEDEVARLRAALAETNAPRFGEGLAEREALLNEAERIVHLGCWMWDTATGEIHWSDEMFRLFGLAPQSHRPDEELFFQGIHPDDAAHVRAVAEAGLLKGMPKPVDFRIVRRDGSVRHAHMEAALVQHEGGMRFVGTILDVTERLQTETTLRHSQKMEAIGTLAGGVAHDFNNYLQVILSSTDLLRHRVPASGDVRDLLAQIREAAERARSLTQQLLLFARRSVSRPEVVSLDALLDEMKPLADSLLGDQIALERRRGACDVRVRADRLALEQVILNLLVNARDAMPNGGTITVEVGSTETETLRSGLLPGSYATVTVRDEGFGIPDHVLPRVFEPFFTTKEPGKGTGLGLATVHGIVSQHGGAVEIESAIGRGTTVRVLLPRSISVASAVPIVRSTRPPPNGSRGRVLVVDDQDKLRDVVCRLLEAAGYDVLGAPDAAEALRIVGERGDVDVVLSDLSMPGMSGLELARTLGANHPALRVVLMAGRPDPSLAGLPIPLLLKPFRRDDLLDAVAAATRSAAHEPPK